MPQRIEPAQGVAELRALLADRAVRRGLELDGRALDRLADRLDGSGRQIDGALARVEGLARLHGRSPTADEVADLFRDEADGRCDPVERIALRVCRYFRVEPRQLRSARRSRDSLVPRQVGMYLARRVTGLSLAQIGAYFGGRDHSTVLHAVNRVGAALHADPAVRNAVDNLHRRLGHRA